MYANGSSTLLEQLQQNDPHTSHHYLNNALMDSSMLNSLSLAFLQNVAGCLCGVFEVSACDEFPWQPMVLLLQWQALCWVYARIFGRPLSP
jgi:hypothetical protein